MYLYYMIPQSKQYYMELYDTRQMNDTLNTRQSTVKIMFQIIVLWIQSALPCICICLHTYSICVIYNNDSVAYHHYHLPLLHMINDTMIYLHIVISSNHYLYIVIFNINMEYWFISLLYYKTDTKFFY